MFCSLLGYTMCMNAAAEAKRGGGVLGTDVTEGGEHSCLYSADT